jgi:nicotinic acid mononucleotide adenylyltransferase
VSAKSNIESGLEKALEGYARLVTEQNLSTNNKIETLTLSVQELVKISIQSEERHKQYDNRFERIEDNQKQSGIERKELIEQALIMGKDAERNAERWAALYKILSGVLTTIIGAAIVAAYVTSK